MNGIYVHVPFCIKKCGYCDFASYPGELSKQREYVNAVLTEAQRYCGAKADTVYIGGGTPTCLDGECLEKLLRGVMRTFDIAENAEVTVEANPKTVDVHKARLLKKCGINRISLGAQSFNDSELRTLGRIHTAADTAETFELLRSEGFGNISLDLMYALPGQTAESLSTSLCQVLKLNPEHVSCYGLKIEDGTPFSALAERGELEAVDDDTFADMYDTAVKILSDGGYERYEISNFSKPGFESRHNMKYWKCDDYIGLGAAAASCIGRRRFTHTRSLDSYMNGFELSEDSTADYAEAMSEFVILGLRMTKYGVDKAEFKRRFGAEVDEVFGERIKKLSQFLENGKKRLKLRSDACLVSNGIMCEFMN